MIKHFEEDVKHKIVKLHLESMNKNTISKLIIYLICIFLILIPINANAAWKCNSIGWWYTEGNSLATGWRQIDGNWYYFYSDGYMATNTTIDGYYVNSDGVWVDLNSRHSVDMNDVQIYLNNMSKEHKNKKYHNCTDTDILRILISNMEYSGKYE